MDIKGYKMADDVMTFDEILTDPNYKSEFDRRVTKAISTVQSKLDAEIKKWEGAPSKDEHSNLLAEYNTAKSELTAATAKIQQYEREKILLAKGVPAEDVDYYAYKAGQLVSDTKTFEQAADEVISARKPQRETVRIDFGAPLQGGGTTKTANDMMNALIRGAGK